MLIQSPVVFLNTLPYKHTHTTPSLAYKDPYLVTSTSSFVHRVDMLWLFLCAILSKPCQTVPRRKVVMTVHTGTSAYISSIDANTIPSPIPTNGLESPGLQSPSSHLTPLSRERLRYVKFAYTTRFAEAATVADDLFLLSGPDVRPEAGDLVLARVAYIGKHKKIETPASRRATLFANDEVVLAYGNRYAADQYLAVVPEDLGPCHMVAAGGVAGIVQQKHANIDEATIIEPLGLITTRSKRVTMSDFAEFTLDMDDDSTPGRPPVIAVFGVAMNSGKTTTAAQLIHGLSSAGHTVGAAKLTGTGSGNDPGLFIDAGAAHVLDFTNFGYPTTFKVNYDRIRAMLSAQIRQLTSAGASVIVMEIADGLYQAENRRLLKDPVFAPAVDSVVFAASDALGAVAGVDFLHKHHMSVACVSGLVTASPIATAEAADVVSVPVTPTFDLAQSDTALAITGLKAPHESSYQNHS